MNYAIVITILAAFKCGFLINLVLGIVAIVYANNARENLASGNYEKALNCAQTAKTLCMIATILIEIQVLLVFFVIALMLCVYLPVLFI